MRPSVFIRLYLIVTFFTVGLLIALGFGGMLQEWMRADSPVPVKQVATQLPGSLFVDAVSSQLPAVRRESSPWLQSAVFPTLFEWFSGIDLFEPRTYLAAAMPGISAQDAILLHPNEHAKPDDEPFDPIPPEIAILERMSEQPVPSNPSERPRAGRKAVLIYHSHNRESWIPELKHKHVTDPDQAFDAQINVTLLGNRLAALLEKKGISTVSLGPDYPSTIDAFKYTKSYTYSMKTVQEAIQRNGSFDFYFDIHRDSQRRKKTTIVREGVSYAQVYFIVGGKNPEWRENYAFAKSIHDQLESRFPGLSKSIYAKMLYGNGVYNQSVSANSVLVEIGGPDNTLEECYRTVRYLADAIAEVYDDAFEVGGGN